MLNLGIAKSTRTYLIATLPLTKTFVKKKLNRNIVLKNTSVLNFSKVGMLIDQPFFILFWDLYLQLDCLPLLFLLFMMKI